MRANKVAVVTGAQRGIGYVIAARFVAEGASVVLADINNASSQVQLLSANGGVAMIVQTDVTRDADVKQLVAQALSRFGHIDIWVNNAGIEFAKTVVDTSEDEWDQLMAVNLKGVFLCSRAVLPGMIERGHGVVINVASELGLVGENRVAAYCASNGGVVMLSKAMALDHGPSGIRINSLCPGPITTDLLEDVFAASPDPEKMRRSFEELTALKRLGRPEDVAAAAVFLASDDSAFTAGTELVVDGGWTAH
jgi:NAD(P)-dependent dehydrogenase (short-subunit alcohol dehydrogenase family)